MSDEEEVPEVFTLRPLSSQNITLIIKEVKEAVFYYVGDEEDCEEGDDAS